MSKPEQERLRADLHHLLLRNGIDGKQYNKVWGDLMPIIAREVRLGKIEELKLMQGGDEEFQGYSEDRIAELSKEDTPNE